MSAASRNIETVNAYLDGFRKNDHQQILSCLTDGSGWLAREKPPQL